MVRRILDGEQGAVRDAVLLNAGAALAVYDAPEAPLREALAAGLERAREAVDSGAARATLDRWVAASSCGLEVQHVRRAPRGGSRAGAGRSTG